MPIQTDYLYWRVIAPRKAAARCLDDESREQAQSDDHVQRVHAGHGKIEREKELRSGGVWSFKYKCAARHQVLGEFDVILGKFYAKKSRTKQNRQNQKENYGLAFPELRGPHGESNGKTTANQHRRVDGAKPHVEMMARAGKRLRIDAAINGVSQKHAAEEHDFGGQKYPHAD